MSQFTSKVVVVQADRQPMEGVANPGPHQIYRNPRVGVQTRELDALHPDEVRVRMIYAGLCGTDVHVVQAQPDTGYIRCSAPARIPPEGRVIGHEGVGEVLETGTNVRHVRPGQFVTFESIIVCHYCDVCRRGQFNQCLRARLLGLEKDGLFGTVVDVPSMLTHDVSDLAATDRGLRAAACVEPAGVAYVACQNTRIGGGDDVVVFGGGPIGLFTAILSKAVFGAASVHLVEPVPFRRQFAARWCDAVYSVEDFLTKPPRAIDVIIDASGHVESIDRVFRRISPNGRIALLARSGEPLTLNSLDYMITNAISIIGSRGHLCGAFSTILSLYKNGRIPLDEIVTQVVEGPDALCSLLQQPRAVVEENCKVLVKL
jgi:threonine dehydrogenase-like Zn-dependent dehydrogenase